MKLVNDLFYPPKTIGLTWLGLYDLGNSQKENQMNFCMTDRLYFYFMYYYTGLPVMC